ncbi:MAG: VWA domain-containing protein [Bryobacteraceae bacterium]
MKSVCLLLICTIAVAQDAPVFRTSTRLVQVDVVVKSKDAPVEGLTKDDFEVRDNGKPQQIAVFSVRDVNTPPPQVVPLPKGVVTNHPQSRGAEPVSATVILMDATNTEIQDQVFAREQTLKYLEETSRHELLAVYALGATLEVLQDFTDDHVVLRAAIRRYSASQSKNLQDGEDGLLAGLDGNAANAARKANFQGQADSTSAFNLLAYHLKGLPGRKKLIWVGSALPLTFTQQNTRNGVVMREFTNNSEQILAPIKLLNDANIAIYPIDPRGGTVCLPPKLCLADPNLTTMLRFAERTGGKALFNDNAVAGGIEQAVSDTDLTYTLGFYPIDQSRNGSEHSISVKVNRRGVEVHYRQSYTAEASKPLTDSIRKGTLNAWVQQPLNATEIPIQAAAAPAISKPGYYDVEVAVDVFALKLEQKNGLYIGRFEVAIAPDTETKPKGLHQVIKVNLTEERLLAAMQSGLVVINQVRVTNDKGKLLARNLHLVVMDQATGKAGSVRIPLTASE